MQIYFTEPAAIELADAFDFYEIHLSGLGKEFIIEVEETVQLITKFPESWSENSKHTRKAVLKRFPFNIIYSVYQDNIYIIAVAHQNRKPEYWIDRLK
ncbi:MAG: type II toxin-antitoxin system RelE/ParE family toxin [Ignavibacteriaceae bacterium]|jgi:hypothetical protein|nr:type II toxin-antitoxin system RelE/ParE family toxin [Ignavibacteriaceae bacterium]